MPYPLIVALRGRIGKPEIATIGDGVVWEGDHALVREAAIPPVQAVTVVQQEHLGPNVVEILNVAAMAISSITMIAVSLALAVVAAIRMIVNVPITWAQRIGVIIPDQTDHTTFALLLSRLVPVVMPVSKRERNAYSSEATPNFFSQTSKPCFSRNYLRYVVWLVHARA